jgi:hypothetical protein
MSHDNQVKNVVDRYISVLIVNDLNEDAGWRSEHMIGRLIEYKGDLPSFAGGGDSNSQMIYQVQLLFNQHQGQRTKQACKIMEVLKKQSPRAHHALVYFVYLDSRPDTKSGRDYHTQERMAEECEMSRSAFLSNVKAGRAFVADMLEIAAVV